MKSRISALSIAMAMAAAPGAWAQSNAQAPHWCPPTGPMLDKTLEADNSLMLRAGWVTLRMHVRPGAVPVTDIRVVSEAGGPGHARVWLPLVKQWTGCVENQRETLFDMTFNFGTQGHYQLPEHEGFGLYAFKRPQGQPALPRDGFAAGVCPIKARLKLKQPAAPNEVIEVESSGGQPVSDWLAGLVPDRDYMAPNPAGNRVEFPCKVDKGEVTFYER